LVVFSFFISLHVRTLTVDVFWVLIRFSSGPLPQISDSSVFCQSSVVFFFRPLFSPPKVLVALKPPPPCYTSLGPGLFFFFPVPLQFFSGSLLQTFFSAHLFSRFCPSFFEPVRPLIASPISPFPPAPVTERPDFLSPSLVYPLWITVLMVEAFFSPVKYFFWFLLLLSCRVSFFFRIIRCIKLPLFPP